MGEVGDCADGLPQQDAVLSTDTRTVDADGFVVYKPLVQGRFSQTNLRRTVAGIVRVEGQFVMNAATSGTLAAERVAGFGWLPQLGVRHRWGELDLAARLDVHERRLGLASAWRGWQLAWGTDRFGGEARSREFRLAYRWTGD